MTTRRSFMSFLAASVVAVSTSIPMLNRKQVEPVRPETAPVPEYVSMRRKYPIQTQNMAGCFVVFDASVPTPKNFSSTFKRVQ